MSNKRGQQSVSMGFGMIFAIFLIVVFVVIAFIAVSYFLDLGDSASVGLFYDDFQKAVNDVVKSQESDRAFVINLPSGITGVCFGDLKAPITNKGAEYEMIRSYDVYGWNVFLIPPEKAENMQGKLVDRINISLTTASKNPYCVDVGSDLRIKKGFYDRNVVIE